MNRSKTEFKINGVRFDRTSKRNGHYDVRMFFKEYNGWVTIGIASTVARVREVAEHYMEMKEIASF